MLNLMLEPTDDRADPNFRDAAGCEKWLAQLQMTNLQLAHSLLLTEINELNRYAMRWQDRLGILELLRDTVDYIQGEYAKKLFGKWLPLTEHELLIFMSCLQLWQAMSQGYQRCLQTLVSSDKQPENDEALLCHRSLIYNGRAIFQYLHTGYEFEGRLWQQFHSLYAHAESRGLLHKNVADPLNKACSNDTCHLAYMRTLLTSYAHLPELSRMQLQLLDTWLPGLIELLKVERQYKASKGDAPPLAFDLEGSQHGLKPAKTARHSENVRYLAMVPLSKWIRVNTILLQQGQTPQQVGLGSAGSSRDCIELLTLLHRCWCEESDMRFIAQRREDQRALLCQGFRNIHTQLGGGVAQQAANRPEDEQKIRKQIETFGRVLQGTLKKIPVQHPRLESWHLDSDSLQSAQLTREDDSGEQWGRNRLAAIRPDGDECFALGVTSWIKVIRTGQLRLGVRYLPGKVEVVTLLATDADKDVLPGPVVGFLLQPENPNIPPSLIIPRECFKPSRVLTMLPRHGDKLNVALSFSVEHGGDFEHVGFKPVPAQT